MNEELHKICMVCSKVYEGNIKTIDENTQYSHGICNDYKCKIDYVRTVFGCDETGAKHIIGGIEKRITDNI